MTGRRVAFTGTVRKAMHPAPPCLATDTPVRDAVAAMVAARDSAVLAVDGAGVAVGILTEQDIARRVAFQAAAEAPFASLMTTPIIGVGAEEPLWRAVGTMRARRLRHLPVLDEAGRPIGMLRRFETYAAASGQLLDHLEALAGGDDEAGFAATRAAQAGLARALLEDGVAAADVIGVVSEINLDIHRRCVTRALAAAGTPPPVPFTLLVMGSAGRGESFLFPDQDNGLILSDPDLGNGAEERHAEVDAWFIPFAEDLNSRLAAAGFTLCKGGVMAMNPLWRKTLGEWKAQVTLWTARRSPAALLFGDIAFDFRAVWGEEAPAQALRAHLTAALAARPAFLAALAAEDSKFGVGLSFWGGFRDDEPGPGTRTDLKLRGLMPLVSATRLLALQHGVAETATRARLAAIAATGALGEAERRHLDAGFGLIVEALLRQQLADLASGLPATNLVDTQAMPAGDRSALRDALKAVASFQKATIAGLTGGI
jgi:signal-transduction protein with cAMP-binding, CBS, and nucleotidyltransferase domain